MSPRALPAHALPLSEQDRRDIAREAATLDERLASPGAAPVSGLEDARDVLDRWAEAFCPGDRRAFARRLSWDGLDEPSVLRALVARPAEDPAAPEWTEWLDRFLDEAALLAARLDTPDAHAEVARVRPVPEPPFIEAWAALTAAARRALGTPDRFRPDAVAAFERALVADLSAAGELALFERFRAFHAPSGSRYSEFMRALLGGGLAAFFKAYPVLARQLAILAATWVAGTREMVERLRRDRDAIAEALGHGGELGDVCAAAPHLSDRHDGGRRVCLLTFSCGRTVVYKPREVGVERAFQHVLAWLADRGLAAPRPIAMVERDGYGWAELVEQEGFEDRAQVEGYFRRAGAAACILHVLRGADAHQENIVATRGGPVLVDSEMLLQPVDRGEERDAEIGGSVDGAAHGVPRSCLSTSFVTLVEVDGDGVAKDVGGLMPAAARAAFGAERAWRGLRSDDLHFVRERTVRRALRNDVVRDGVVQRPEDFAAEILAGFADAYRLLVAERPRILARDGPLASFAGRRSRILFRPSEQYGFFLHALFAPRYQRRGIDRSVALEMLNRVFAQEERRPALWPLVAEERRALEDLDVPRYLLPAESSVLVAAGGVAAGGHLVRSGLDAVRAGLHAMDEADLATQLDLLDAALDEDGLPPTGSMEAGGRADGTGLAAARRDANTACLGAAEALGDRILARARRDDEGTPSWSHPTSTSAYDLYRGQAGIALFLAALAAVTRQPRFLAAASASLRPFSRALEGDGPLSPVRWPSVGACDGLGSVVYAVAMAGRLLGDGAWSETAERWGREISPDRIDGSVRHDVAGGTAGALLALLALEAGRAETTWVRERIRHCVRRLAAGQVTTGGDAAAWPSADGRTPAGFAHGAGGIAYALARAFAKTGDAEIVDRVRRAHRHERRLFSPAAGNWPAAHEGGTVLMTAWCHGAPGIGIARTLALPAFDDHAIRAEIRAALDATLAAGPGRDDHLCCGVMGRSEALLVMGACLREPPAVAAAEAMATRVAEAVLARGTRALRTENFEHRTFQPGFFRGLAGIGYQLLRTAAPTRIPSVLGFEAGAARRA